MKLDRYTKLILTYIAVCLTLIALKEFGVVSYAHAQQGPIRVVIDQGGPVPVVICDRIKCVDIQRLQNGLDGLVVAVPR
jgi:hypothetical protein